MSLKAVLTELKRHRRPGLNWLVAGVIGGLFAAGWVLILAPAWAAWLGAAALAEAMILSFYLSHDCAHLCAFPTRRQNLVMGQILAFLSGGGASGFGDYRRDHLRHHAEQMDFIGLDLNQSWAQRWRPLRAAIELLESCYIPALFFVIKWETVWHDMVSQAVGRRAAVAGCGVRLASVTALAALRPHALLWFVIAVFARIHCIRFVDAFQHVFEHGDLARRSRHRGWDYEQRQTFSFPVFKRHRFLNLMTLNFGYHNAHHAVPHCPWYNLPRLDALLRQFSCEPETAGRYPYQPEQAGVAALLKSYHKYRVLRLFTAEPDAAYDEDGRFSLTSFRGVLSDHLLG
jgi:fatty acid desaturase